jgi:putative ABC transport system permease protein
LAVVLAAIGVYGAMSYAVIRRTREIGIRVAIGAIGSNVIGLVLQRTTSLLGIGIMCGSAAALAAGRFFSAVLYGIGPRDLGTYVLAIVLMTAVTLLACVIPVRRALAVDPVTAKGQE